MYMRETTSADLRRLETLYRDAFRPKPTTPDDPQPAKDESGEIIKLVRQIIQKDHGLLSLAAVQAGRIVGHILCTSVTFSRQKTHLDTEYKGAILAPMGVLPAMQGKGIGQGLIKAACDMLQEKDIHVISVYGDPAYYGKSGFHPQHKIKPPFDLSYPIEAWMAKSLAPDTHPIEDFSAKLTPVAPLMHEKLW